MRITHVILAVGLTVSTLVAQAPAPGSAQPPTARGPAEPATDPFPQPFNAVDDVITVDFVEFASIPDDAGGLAARMMLLVDEPRMRRVRTCALSLARSDPRSGA